MVKIFRLVTSWLILGFILVAVPAMAGQVKTGPTYGPYQTGLGGEFTLEALSADMLLVLNNGYVDGVTKNVPNAPANTFQTFCLEHNEYISTNTTYDVTISNSAKNGGVSGAVSGADPISVGTAWLYSNFATGNLAAYGYDYTNPGRSNTSGGLPASAGQLQNAIWMLEGEIGLASNAFISAMLTANNWVYSYAASTDANGAYGVAVLNLGAPGQGQDQLVMVPEPSTLVLLGVCLVGIAIAARRFKVQA